MPKRKLPKRGQVGEVYLLHLDKPVGHAQHYTGFALDATERLKDHQAGRGGRLLQVANTRGITYQVARVWAPADRRFERRVKNYARARQLCPVCNPETWQTNLAIVGDAKRIKKPRRRQS